MYNKYKAAIEGCVLERLNVKKYRLGENFFHFWVIPWSFWGEKIFGREIFIRVKDKRDH